MIQQVQFPFRNEENKEVKGSIFGTILFFGGLFISFLIVSKMAVNDARGKKKQVD